MTKLRLNVDVKPDRAFVTDMLVRMQRRWSEFSAAEQVFLDELTQAQSKGKKPTVESLLAALSREQQDDASLDDIVSNLRKKFRLPIIVSAGRVGGYRLPISRQECELILRNETSALFKRMERLLDSYRAVREFGLGELSDLESLGAMLKLHQMESAGESDEVKPRKRRKT